MSSVGFAVNTCTGFNMLFMFDISYMHFGTNTYYVDYLILTENDFNLLYTYLSGSNFSGSGKYFSS